MIEQTETSLRQPNTVAVPGRGLSQLYRLAWVGVYLAVFFLGRHIVPDRFLRDASKLADVVNSGFQDSRSFANTAILLDMIPEWFIGLTGAFVIYTILKSVRSLLGMLIVPIAFMPMAISNMMAGTKETIIILMTITLLFAARHMRRSWLLILLIGAFYIPYGIFIRPYYGVIYLVFVMLVMVLSTPWHLRWLYFVFALALPFIIPVEWYDIVQGQRDTVARWISIGSPYGARTVFSNYFPTTGFLYFVGNYFYAIAMLNFPFLIDTTVSEMILFANVVIWFTLIIAGYKLLRGPPRLLALLFLAHLMVLWLFETDLGGYVRHATSVFLYLVPALTALENWRRERLARRAVRSETPLTIVP